MHGLRPNVAHIKKADLVKMSRWRCKHGETGLSHYRCWLREHPDTERIGFFDIEASNLKSDFGIILTYAIKAHNEDTIYQQTITKRDLSTCLDEKVVRQCVNDLQKFDRVCTWYGANFDMKFLRSRALALGIDFPEYGSILHNDIYYIAKNKLCLSSNRLDNVSRALFGDTVKTRIVPEKWIKALMGDKDALAYIAEHCRLDVIELEKVYNALCKFSRKANTSI